MSERAISNPAKYTRLHELTVLTIIITIKYTAKSNVLTINYRLFIYYVKFSMKSINYFCWTIFQEYRLFNYFTRNVHAN